MNRLSCFRCDHDICDRYDIKLLKLDCNIIHTVKVNTSIILNGDHKSILMCTFPVVSEDVYMY